jgi:Acetamidase/Formamidase family
MEHYLPSTPDNLHWRWRNGPPRPVIKIASGDRVTVETLSGEPDEVLDPAPEISVAPGETTEARADGPLLTGPIHIEDAEPGDILEVRVLDIELRSDWGWNLQISASNSMPDDLLDFCRRHVPLDRSRNVAHLPWGKELNLSPFFGNFGVASSTERRLFDLRNRRDLRGHIDNKDIGRCGFAPHDRRHRASWNIRIPRSAQLPPHRSADRSRNAFDSGGAKIEKAIPPALARHDLIEMTIAGWPPNRQSSRPPRTPWLSKRISAPSLPASARRSRPQAPARRC